MTTIGFVGLGVMRLPMATNLAKARPRRRGVNDILSVTGQAPVARLHREDFQAVDIDSIAAPVTTIVMTVLEPARFPGAVSSVRHRPD